MGSAFDSVRCGALGLIIGLVAVLAGCSSSSPTRNTTFPVPGKIVLNPATPVSLNVGSATQTFTATPQNNKGTAITTPVGFVSSNTAVLTIANNGTACAGTWDSLSAPQICTPGPVGVAQVTATSHGISSPPTTVYVHQRIDKIVISPIPNQTPPAGPCFSKGQVFNYQANAFSQGLDITNSVGPFTWQAITAGVATLKTATESELVSGLAPGQLQVTATNPGVTGIFASLSNVTSQTLDFTTCPVESITLAVTGSGSNTINVTAGAGKSITATVIDSMGNTITGVPLTWSSSQAGTVGVSAAGAVTTSKAGGASVIASCTPPTCNIGFQPLLPIYPENAINVVAAPATSTTTTAGPAATVYVSSTGTAANCATTTGCFSTLVPVTGPANTLGTAVTLPATPNSLVFDRQGTKAYLGTDFGFLGSRGLMVVTVASPPTVSEVKSVTGKVLAVSPDGKGVIISDTKSSPNQVFVFNTSNNSTTTLPIVGATAADYSPDSLKAYILAGSTLYVYSTIEALQTIPLGTAANDVSFLADGAFAYLAGGTASGVTVHTTCTNTLAATVATPQTPAFLKTLPNGLQVLAVDSPGIDIINVSTAPVGCSPTVSNTVTSFNLGRGAFVPTQLIMSQDGARAYVITNNLGSVLVFNIGNQTSSAIPLAGDAIPVQASLTPDGARLYIAAADGQVHVLDTEGGNDIQQVSFPTDVSTFQAGFCVGTTITCNPDLIAVKP